MLDDVTLREAYRAAAEPMAPHVSEESWERLACGELSVEEREGVLDHTSKCTECATLLKALLLVERGARDLDPSVPVGLTAAPARAGMRARGRKLLWSAVAAAAALAIVWLTLPSRKVLEPFTPDGNVLRSAGESHRPVPKGPLDVLARVPESFSWEGSAAARAYQVELFDADGESIWQSGEVAGTSLPWPEQIRPEPGRYYWRVFAILAERGERIASPLVSFDLTR
jgi:hypothetical protein